MGNLSTDKFQGRVVECLVNGNNELTLDQIAKIFKMSKPGVAYHLNKICSKSVLVKKDGIYSLSVRSIVSSSTQPLEERITKLGCQIESTQQPLEDRIVKLERQVKVLIAALVTSGRQIDEFALNL